MYCFDSDGTYSPISPLKKRPVGRRSFVRQITQASILAGLMVLVFMFGRDLMWSSSTNSYTIDPRDMDIVQSLCNAQNMTGGNSAFLAAAAAATGGENNQEEARNSNNEQVPSYLASSDFQPDTMIASETWQHLPIKGALYMLVSNENLQEARAAMRSVEDRFNHHYKYPWVLLNNQDFTPTFLKYIRKATTDAPIYFGKIDARAWSYPNWIDIRSAEDHMDIMYAMNVYRGGSLSFRQLLRYQSGLFVHHPLFRDVDYIWRVEPGSEVTCDMVDYDPFAYMKKYNKTLGLTLTMRESHGAVDNLWSDTRQFMEARPKHVLPYNETIMSWITDQGKADYNMCHLWSNFEIVETSFLRSKAYQDYFEFLDRKGGFFYERWGDNPVRTMAAAMFLPRNRIHFFNRIGYTHSVASHCPINKEDNIRCSCDMYESFDFHADSCTADLLRLLDDPALQEMVTFAEKQLQDSESSAPAFDLKEIKNEEHGTTQDETESMGKTMDELTDQAVAVDSAAFVNEDFMALLQDEMQNENLAELAMAQTSAGDRLQQFADEEEEDMMMA